MLLLNRNHNKQQSLLLNNPAKDLMNTSKGNERINDDGAVEINVETVDYRKPAGREEEPPQQEKVAVTHLIHDDKPGGAPASFVAGAAAKVGEKLQSAKEAVSAETTSNSKAQ